MNCFEEGTAIIKKEIPFIPLKKFKDDIMHKIEIITAELPSIRNDEARKEIKTLMEEKYAVRASEGNYTDKDMIESGLIEIMAVWKTANIAESCDKDTKWRFSKEGIEKILHSKRDLDYFYITEIET